MGGPHLEFAMDLIGQLHYDKESSGPLYCLMTITALHACDVRSVGIRWNVKGFLQEYKLI